MNISAHQIGLVWSLVALLLSIVLSMLSAANNGMDISWVYCVSYSPGLVGVLVGASVRAKMLTPRLAKRLTAFLYFAGALALGGRLSRLATDSIVSQDLAVFGRRILLAVLGTQLAVIGLLCLAIWVIKLPLVVVQLTVIGSLVSSLALGVHLVPFNVEFIVLVWFAAPVLTLGLTMASRRFTQARVWEQLEPLAALLGGLSLFFALISGIFATAFMAYAVFGDWLLDWNTSWPVVLGASVGTGLAVGVITYYLAYYFGVPAIKKWVFAQFQETWQEYLPQDGHDQRAAARASMEQRGICVAAPPAALEPAAGIGSPVSRKSSASSRGPAKKDLEAGVGKSLSCIRAEEAFGYPQIFILSLLLFLDGGILYAGISGPLLALVAPHLLPGMPFASMALWSGLLAAALPLGVLLLADAPLEAFTRRFYADMSASESFHMEFGTLLPCLAGLVFGVPVSAVQCKLNVLFLWMAWVRPGGLRASEGPIIRNTLLFWLLSGLLAATLPALLAWSVNQMITHY